MKRIAITAIIVFTAFARANAAMQWQQYGGDARHNPVTWGMGPSLAQPRLTIGAGRDVSATSTPAIFEGSAIVYCSLGAVTRVVAFTIADGSEKWTADVEDAVMDSWSSPAVDPASRSVLIASGRKVFALNADTGAVRWSAPLGADVVNASVTIAAGKAFISTFATWGETGKLAAIHLDPAAGTVGSIAWSKPTGQSSGNTPAYFAGSGPADAGIIVADMEGRIRSFDPANGAARWTYSVPGAGSWDIPGGAFTGGVCVAGNFCYASTYNFYGGENNSYTCKLNARTGSLEWRTASERTAAVPAVYEGKIIVSAGIDGYGSHPKLQAFNDADGDKLWETTGVGGWTLTPAAISGVCYIGTLAEGAATFDYCEKLNVIDLAKTPGATGFIIGSYTGAGGTAAWASGSVYSVGTAGLCAFDQPLQMWPIHGDANLDCRVNILDLIFIRGKLNLPIASGNNWQANVNRDASINILDLISVRGNLGKACP